jgi:hypothetical protein
MLQNPIYAYVVVFSFLAALLLISVVLLRRIDVTAFRKQAEGSSVFEKAALAGEV